MGFRRFSLISLSQWVPTGTVAHHGHNGIRLLNCLGRSKYCTNLTLQSRILCNQFSDSAVHFPWRQNVVDNTKEDPVLHRLFGMILLRRVLKNYSSLKFLDIVPQSSFKYISFNELRKPYFLDREEFDIFGFIEGVKIAIKALSNSVTSEDREGHMVNMLGNHLHDRFCKAFDELKKASQKAVLEIETAKNFKVIGVRAVCGSADPGDEYCINILGQKIITSKHDMFELEKRANFAELSSLFDYGRQLGYSAAEKQLKFQLDVKFSSSERFYIQEKQNGNGQVVFGSQDLVSATHNIRLESLLGDITLSDEHYPLSWKIIDIDFKRNDTDP